MAVEDLAGLVRGARAAILPVVSEAAGLPVIEALACGTPVVASAVGPLPELVGAAGLLVEPRDPDRLAVALATIWVDDTVHAGIAALARERAEEEPRTWADVARETRSIYAEVGAARVSPATTTE
jgi:glycosyltransferase involved in cell wall biosynthesis